MNDDTREQLARKQQLLAEATDNYLISIHFSTTNRVSSTEIAECILQLSRKLVGWGFIVHGYDIRTDD